MASVTVIRELEKIQDAVTAADEYFSHQTRMNAHLHLADPRPAPLAAKITIARESLDDLISLMKSWEEKGREN